MKLALELGPPDDQWETHITYALEAERLGIDFVWSPELWGYDAVTPLAYLAAKTSRIRLGTGIMQIGARTPAMIAMTAMTMSALSQDRFVLGLGVSGPQVMEGWHGVAFARPLQRTQEIIDIVRMIARGERLTYTGEIYHLPLPGSEGKALVSFAQPQPNLPIYLATLGPKNLELTGELADGWLGTSFLPEHARLFFDHIETGARRGRFLRRPGPPDCSAQTWSSVHPGSDGFAPTQFLQ
jgi:F420-dependent oxidoreductase-like protein